MQASEFKTRLDAIRKDSFELEFRSEVKSLLSKLEAHLEPLGPKHHSQPFKVEKKTQFSELSRKHATLSFITKERIKVKVEYSTVAKEGGMWWWKSLDETGTLLLESIHTKEIVRFKIHNEHRDSIVCADLHRLAECIEQFVLKNNLSAQDEHNVLRTINHACGSDQITYTYLLHRDETGYLSFQGALRDYYNETLYAITLFKVEVLTILEELESKLDGEDVSAILGDYVTTKKAHIDAVTKEFYTEFEIEKAKKLAELKEEEESFNKKLEARKEDLESQYQSKFQDLEKKQADADARLVELNEKLRDHRIKVHEEFYKIAPKLVELFPDVEDRGTYDRYKRKYIRSYEITVDGNLRTYYAQKLKSKIEENQHTSVSQCLLLLELFKDNCFARNKHPRGEDVRRIFAGLYCVIDYVATHDVELDKILALVKANGRQKNQAKLDIEHLLEQSLSCDFDMNRFKGDLHAKDATDRKSLKLK